MARYTIKTEKGFEIEKELFSEAVAKLGRFEDLVEAIRKDQEELSKELETLRNTNKKNSYHFKESMGKKLTNSTFLTLVKKSGLQ